MTRGCVLILKSDILSAAALRERVSQWDASRQCHVVHRLDEARTALIQHDVGLFITGLSAPDGDVLDLLLQMTEGVASGPRVLVATRFKQSRLLASLRMLSLGGVFDTASEQPDRIVHAMRAVEHGYRYWSDSLQLRVLEDYGRSVLAQLSPTEQLALALLGDGCADKVAAQRLGMTLSSARGLRRELHRKLGAHDRADLIRLALQHGYVRNTPDGLTPFGLDILRRESSSRKRRLIGEQLLLTSRLSAEDAERVSDRGMR